MEGAIKLLTVHPIDRFIAIDVGVGNHTILGKGTP